MTTRRLHPDEVDALSDRYVELRRYLLGTLEETARVILPILRDAPEPAADDRERLRERLRAGAECLRALYAEVPLVEVVATKGPRGDLRPALQILRRVQRSIVLMLAEDGAVRAHAGTASDHATAIRTVFTDLQQDQTPGV